jgi:hypothetical protein
MKNVFLIALLMLSGCAEASQTSSNHAAVATTFGSMVYRPINGKVGYHITANPADYGNYSGGTPCAPGEYGEMTISKGGRTVEGTLPPGLTASDGSHGHLMFEGTPRQAGDWDVQVTDHGLYCTGGALGNHGPSGGGDYGDRTGTLRIHIDP